MRPGTLCFTYWPGPATLERDEREEVLRNMDEVEPLSHRGASFEVDTSAPPEEVAELDSARAPDMKVQLTRILTEKGTSY